MRRALPRFAALATAVTAALSAPLTTARADDAAPRPPPVDVGALPPVSAPEPRPLGVELHGLTTLWWLPWSQPSPTAAADAVRLRFAVLRIDARPAPKVSVLGRLGLMLPGSPLLDLAATYQPTAAVGLTFGQFRLPLGASATTLAPQLVMLDRPGYVYAMTKLAFRDVGAMLHSGPAGLAGGRVHLRLAVTSGSGRMGGGAARPPAAAQYLVAGRAMLDVGRDLFGPGARLLVGASLARSRDPAIATGSAATDATAAAGVLGRTLAPIGFERDTSLAGADLTFARGPAWAQAEAMFLRSDAIGDPARREALGISVEAAWRLPLRPAGHELQVATRHEWFDPDLDADGDERDVLGLGVNASTARLRWSVFGGLTRFEDAATGAGRRAGELAVRAAATF